MFVLFKLAGEGRGAARARISDPKKLGGRLWGALWSRIGRDPAAVIAEEMGGSVSDPEIAAHIASEKAGLVDMFMHLVDETVPGGISDELGGAAYRLAAKWWLGYFEKHMHLAENHPDWSGLRRDEVSLDRSEDSWSERFKKDIRAYNSLHQDDIKNYNAEHPEASFPTDIDGISSPEQLHDLVVKMEPLIRYRHFSQQADGSEHLAGTPGDPALSAKVQQGSKWGSELEEEQEKDLVNGLVVRDEWHVVIPHNANSARHWGAGAKWCTAHDDADYHESYHRPDDPLIILTNSRTGHRYQFHYGTDQFQDPRGAGIESIALAKGLHDFVTDLNVQHPKSGMDYFSATSRMSLRDVLADPWEYPEDTEEKAHAALEGLAGQGSARGGLISSKDESGAIQPLRVGNTLIWAKDGVPHREVGPAVVGPNRLEYYYNGRPQKSYSIDGAYSVRWGDQEIVQWHKLPDQDESRSLGSPIAVAERSGSEIRLTCFEGKPIVNSGESSGDQIYGRYKSIRGTLPNGPILARPENPEDYPPSSLNGMGEIDPQKIQPWSNYNRCRAELRDWSNALDSMIEDAKGIAEYERKKLEPALGNSTASGNWFRLWIKSGM